MDDLTNAEISQAFNEAVFSQNLAVDFLNRWKDEPHRIKVAAAFSIIRELGVKAPPAHKKTILTGLRFLAYVIETGRED